MIPRTAHPLAAPLAGSLLLLVAGTPARALSLSALTGRQRITIEDCVPGYDPPAPGSWLLELHDPAAAQPSERLGALRESARGLTAEVARRQLVTYLPYLIPNRDAQTLALEAMQAQDWTATLSLVTRHAAPQEPDLGRVVFSILATLQGQYATAAGYLDKIPAEQRRASPLAALAQAHLNVHAGRYPDALSGLDGLVLNKPWPETALELLLARSCVHEILGRGEKAAADVETVLDAMSRPERMATEIGRRFLLARQWEAAQRWFETALRRRADYAPAASGLVLSHFNRGAFAEASRAADQWFRPADATHIRIRAELLHRSGDTAGALAELRRLRGQRPDNLDLAAWEASILLDRCELDAALALLEPLLGKEVPTPLPILEVYARALEDAGEYIRLERILERLPEPAAERDQHRFIRAWWLSQQEEYERALADLETCIESGYTVAPVHALLGAVHTQLHNRMRAVESFAAARDSAEEPLRMIAVEAEAQLEARRLDDAGVLIQQLLDAAPDSGWACLLRARLFDLRGRHGEAIEWCERALSLGAPERETRLQRLESFLRARDYAQAQTDADFLAEHYPSSPAVLTQRAVWRFHNGDPAGAQADAAAVLQRGRSRERAQAAVLLGVAAAQRGATEEALRLAEQAIQIRANLAEPYLLRGALKLRERNYVAAEADFTRALRLEPNLQEAYDLRGRTLQEKGYFREAIRDFSQAIDLGGVPGDLARWHLQRALCQVDLSSWERAQMDIDRARAIAPELPDAHFVKGRLHAAQAQWQEAVTELNRYLTLRSDPAAAQLRDSCLRQLGEAPPAEVVAAADQGPAAAAPPPGTAPAAAGASSAPAPAAAPGEEDPISLLIRATRSIAPAVPTPATPSPLTPSLDDMRTRAQASPEEPAALLALAQAEAVSGTREAALRALAGVVAALQVKPSKLAEADRARLWDGVINLTGLLRGTPDALHQASLAVEDLPQNIDLRGLRAAIALVAGDAATAATDSAFVLEREPMHLRGRLIEAQLLLNGGQAQLAEEKLGELAAAYPQNADVEIARGLLFASRRDWAAARQAADRALELGSTNAECRRLRARAGVNLGRYDEALADLEIAASKDPANQETALLQATALGQMGRVDDALALLDRRVKEHPEDWAALHLLCNLGLQSARRAEVIETLLPLGLERFPEKAPFHVLQGRILLENREIEKALEAANQAVRKDPGLAEAWQLRGRILGAAQSYEQAERDLAQAIQLDPSLAEAWSDLGAVRLQQKKAVEALESLRKAAELAPAHPLNLYRLGLAYLDTRQPGQAVHVFARLREADPTWLEGWRQGIVALRRAGHADQADALAAEARQRFPDQPGL